MLAFSEIAQKDDKHFGYFCNKMCHQNLSKIAQSGRSESLRDSVCELRK